MTTLRIGMISFAHGHAFAYFHALRRMPGIEISGIADPERGRVQSLTDEFGIRYFADYEQLLALGLDAVVICSENALHAEHAIAAARSGAHVLCEKPLGITPEQMDAMILACRDQSVQLMTAFPCRYLPAVREAKRLIDQGEIGDIVAIKGTNRGTFPGGWFVRPELSGGGALLDHTVHVMDLMHWITGAKADTVYAYAANLFQPGLDVDDAGMLHVRFDSGAIGVIDTSWSRQAPFPTWGDVTMEITGTRGSLFVDALAQKNEVYSRSADQGRWDYWGDDMDTHMIQAFIDAIRSGKPVPISGEDGRRAALVALTGYRSIEAGRAIPLIEA
ncbi:Gfo/Idh/MocA family protein [Paenibacillus methanolicus]|uniref:Putative dehydrogenase n=1 Tax=Paenibacillus methanolicus TaxID=582686 RepID=A0A5S5CLI6_9BACL|nr:Gfo/Idh/MocA family oxidoreductase [Paenibacillus methanolicus]TYP79717.1 putative dehydrogenase [Paenibacillus methanolicus]